jgi:thymidylate kinase
MIIELFGAPAVGKTTLSNVLATALRSRGCDVQLIASSRPAELAPDLDECAAGSRKRTPPMIAPFFRAAKLASGLRVLTSCDPEDVTGAALLQLLPPQRLVTMVRLRRYLSQLHHSWSRNIAYKGIAIVDQGYVSALCSLAVRTRWPSAQSLARGLEFAPKPHLLVCLDAPDSLLQTRIAERLGRQSAIERMFEQDFETNQKQVQTVRMVANMAREGCWPVIDVSCVDKDELEIAVGQIVNEISAQREAA